MSRLRGFIFRRVLIGVVTLWTISLISFVIIELPPGDFVSTYIAQLAQVGSTEDAARLRADYELDKPVYVRYASWMWRVLHGDFGRSLDWNRPVSELIAERLAPTLFLAFGALLCTWMLALPIGIYCAVNRRSLGDYLFTSLAMIGLSIPSFLLALAAMYIAFRYFNVNLGNLHSEQFEDAPWSGAKLLDMMVHLALPSAIIAWVGAARLTRILRANLLDELGKPYVVTARAKGMRESHLILKYPTRVALNPFVSTIGILLPQLVSGSVIVSLVMSLPTIGPLLLRALQAQDMFLASTITLALGALTVAGTLVSDLLLAWLDPRIRLND